MAETILKRAWRAEGCHGNSLVGDIYEASAAGSIDQTVLLLHGGGQTRLAWENTARQLSEKGFRVIAIDQRGHGDSEWDSLARYAFADFGDDILSVAETLCDSESLPAVVGASLGGIAALLAQGATTQVLFSAMIFVDITPFMRADGVDRIEAFMRHHSNKGFSTLEEAADAVARYLPHRAKPANADGLAKNLRRGDDNRWYWHWDPNFLEGPRTFRSDPEATRHALIEACGRVTQPALLVRGGQSELIDRNHVEAFQGLVPQLQSIELDEARHMVVGDRNDAFAEAISGFLTDTMGRNQRVYST